MSAAGSAITSQQDTSPRFPAELVFATQAAILRTTVKPGPQRHRAPLLTALAGVALGVSIPACARKAPGPEECHALAVRWTASERGHLSHRLGELVFQAPSDAILERTNECLTTPYDRELVDCIQSGGVPRACFAGFRSRTVGSNSNSGENR